MSKRPDNASRVPRLGDDSLFQWLERVDALIVGALATVPVAGRKDSFRGLHVGPQDVEALLGRPPGVPLFGTCDILRRELLTADMPLPPWLQRMVQSSALSTFDVAVLLVALAPEVDLRYERLYGYLQDDVRRTRPTVDLALNLLTVSPQEKLQRRMHFASVAPLVRDGLIRLSADPLHPDGPLLARRLAIDPQVLAAAIGDCSLDERLEGVARFLPSHAESGDPAINRRKARATVYLSGPSASERLQFAVDLARSLQRRLLVVDVTAADRLGGDLADRLHVAVRECWLKDAILFIDGYDAVRAGGSPTAWRACERHLSDAPDLVLISGASRWAHEDSTLSGVVTVDVALPGAEARSTTWRAAVSSAGVSIDDHLLDALATRFVLSRPQICDSVASAHNAAACRGDVQPTAADYFVAARSHATHALDSVAVKLTPRATWADLVLPDHTLAQLKELCSWIVHRSTVLDEWGFGAKLSYGKGANALFTGASGTGKTLAAEIIAAELELDLFRIDLATVISKYIGETEKNLDRIFAAAEHANAILFFDEADALFGKRSEIKDAHDRYANAETAYLLQKMELYEGMAILATNLRQNLDDAIVRRLAFTITFPFPDEAQRRRIWDRVWPREVAVAPDLDLEFCATQFKLSGGSIKNVALAAAFLAAADGGVVGRGHVLHAIDRELEKLGKPPSLALFPAGAATR